MKVYFTIRKEPEQVKRLFNILNELDRFIKIIEASSFSEKRKKKLLSEIRKIQLKARDRLENRQLGAWKSNKITAYSVLYNTIKVSRARLRKPSAQDESLLSMAKELIDEIEEEFIDFKSKKIKELN